MVHDCEKYGYCCDGNRRKCARCRQYLPLKNFDIFDNGVFSSDVCKICDGMLTQLGHLISEKEKSGMNEAEFIEKRRNLFVKAGLIAA